MYRNIITSIPQSSTTPEFTHKNVDTSDKVCKTNIQMFLHFHLVLVILYITHKVTPTRETQAYAK